MMVTIAILAGGHSTRMGRDKAQLPWGKLTFLEHLAGVAGATGQPVSVVGRGRPAEWNLPEVDFITDEEPGMGPLGGLITALREFGGPVLALGCDMPMMTTEAIQWLLSQTVECAAYDGAAVRCNGRFEPLFSLYNPSSRILGEARLAMGRFALQGLIENGNFQTLDAPEWMVPLLRNVNTPEEFQELQKNI